MRLVPGNPSWKARACLLAVVLGLGACAAPRPSTEPLGVGPLPATYHLGGHTAPRPTDRVAAATSARSETKEPPSGDGGAKAIANGAGGAVPGPSGGGKDHGSSAAAAAVAALDPSLFVGEYTGEDVSTYRLSGLPEREDRDPKARITVKAPGDKTIAIVLIDSSDGKEICTLTAVVGEASATITPGQKCFEQTGETASATATIRSGTATIEKRRLIVDLDLAFEMHVPDQDATGTLLYHFDGTRR